MLKTVEALYTQKDYQGALKLLQENQTKVSSGLWNYNVGTVLGKLGNYPLARFHLLQAEKEGFHTKELILNRELVESRLEISKLEKPSVWTDYVVQGSSFLSQGFLTTISLVLVIAGIVSLFKRSSYKTVSLFLVSGAMVLSLNWWVSSWTKMIVVQPQIIHSGPSAIFPTQESLPAGLLMVTRQEGEWLEVIYPARFSGWVKYSGLMEIK